MSWRHCRCDDVANAERVEIPMSNVIEAALTITIHHWPQKSRDGLPMNRLEPGQGRCPRLTLRLPESQREAIDAIVRRTGRTRGDVVREALAAYLADDRDRLATGAA